MLEIIKSFIKEICRYLGISPYSLVLAAYLMTIVWFKAHVYALYVLYGFLPTILMVLAFPLSITLIPSFKRKQNKSSASKSSDAIKQFSNQQLFTLRKHIPTAQLNLLENILLISFGLLYDLLTSLPSNRERQATLFDDKYHDILNLFKKISKYPEFKNGSVATRSRNNAIICFAFYRNLFSDVLVEAKKHNVLAGDLDPWILLKRIPPNVSVYLGSQNWRLYELKNILFDDLNFLEINDDIKLILKDLCNYEFKDVSHIDNNVDNSDVKQEYTVSGDLALVSDKETPATNQHIEMEDTHNSVLEKRDNKESDLSTIKKMVKWLPRQLSRYPVNSGNYFYIDMDKYGKGLIFLTATALSNFSQKSNISLQDIKNAIKNFYAEGVKEYRINDQSSEELFALTIDFDAEVSMKMTTVIMEVK